MTPSLPAMARTPTVATGSTREGAGRATPEPWCGSSVRKEHLEEEGKPVGFNKDQMAAEITRCSSAEEDEAEEPFEWEGWV